MGSVKHCSTKGQPPSACTASLVMESWVISMSMTCVTPSACPGQDGGPVLDDRVPLHTRGGVQQRGVNQASGEGLDAHRG
jgi:hypothetical protein